MARAIIVICCVVIILCLMPLAGVVWSSWFAERHGCVLHEGGYNPCVVNGKDYGGLLGGAFISGWLMLLSLPLAALSSLVLVATLVVRWILNRRAAR